MNINQRPKFYTVVLNCASVVTGVGRGSVTLDSVPFVLTRITHEILGADDENLYQDGQYLVSWRDDIRSYCQIPAPADCLFGSAGRHGQIYPLPSPVQFEGNRTITFEVQNLIDRTGAAPTFQIAFVLHGIEPA
jgi:hypothetical protein